MKGQQYLGFSTVDKVVKQNVPKAARQIGPTCLSAICIKRKVMYCQKFDELTRNNIFKMFWNMSWEAKRVFLKAYISQIPTKRTIVENSKKQKTFVYKLPYNHESLQVCRSMFLSTLSINRGILRRWLVNDKPVSSPHVKQNERHTVHSKNAGCRRYLGEYFENLDKMESHYCRKDSSKVYIATTFKTKADIYKDYKSKCLDNQVRPVSISTFKHVFAEQNLALYMPRKDECDTCVGFKAKQVAADEYNTHIFKKERAQLEKQRDKLAAQEGRCYVFTMDAQAVKLCPDINASAIYYKQRLQVHNFTIYNLATHQCTNYWWNETNGDLSASTFISCIIYHLKTHCLSDTLPIIIYSDGCGYQNRNHYLSNALSIFAIENSKIIEQKYLEKGHTQMECDSAHAKIEVKLKKQTIYLPNDYVRITKEARKTVKIDNKIINMPFNALYLDYSFFKNYTDVKLIRFTTIRPGRNKNDPTVSQIKSLIYLPSGDIKYKLSFDEEYMNLPTTIKTYEGYNEPKPLLSAPRPIQPSKWKHLQALKLVIPREYHYFYDNLKQAKKD